MSYYLYYCKNCNKLEVDNNDNTIIRCSECNERYYPLHVTEDDWDYMSDEDRRSILQKATVPEMNVRRTTQQGVQNNSRRMAQNNYSGKEGKITGLSIAAFILSITGCLAIVGLIMGIIDLTKKDGRKKGLSIAAVVIGSLMVIASFTYAGSSSKKELKSDTVTAPAVETTDLAVENNEEPTSNDTEEQPVEDNTPVASEITINEQVLVDQDGVKITAVEYETDSIWGDGIKMLLENNTNQNLMFSCQALIVNDFMITDLFAKSVAAGKNAYETMHLSNSQLREAGIDNVGKIEIYFRVYDDDTWDDLFKTDCITLQTSDYASMDETLDIEGIELYNKNDIKIYAKYVDENSFWGKAILLYVENHTDKNITVSADNLSINGFMFTPMYSDTIYAGKKSFNDITLFSSELEENGVTEIKDVELKFRIYDSETYDDIDETDAISFSVN